MGHLEIGALMSLLIPLGCGCILPIFAIWMGIRKEMNESKNRTQVMLAAIEKNPDVDIEELMAKISPKKKLLKEKLLNKLLAGCITAFLGIGFLGYTAYAGYVGYSSSDNIKGMFLLGVVLLGVGIALFINYFVGKKMLAKEMEAEETKLSAQGK
ncbi:MAG: hypothetical protein IKH43_00690 [Bacteroidaceae bacterium]|nr:hypothetical protein [Bacteroidaceae bacterium]